MPILKLEIFQNSKSQKCKLWGRPPPPFLEKVYILNFFFFMASLKAKGTLALHLNEPAGGSCCDAGLGFIWHCYCIYMTFVCLKKKNLDLF